MLIVRREAQVDAAKLFEVLTDVADWPRWTTSMTSVKREDQGPLTLGSRAEVVQPKLRPSVWEVAAIRSPGGQAQGGWEALTERLGVTTDACGFFWSARNPGVTTVGGHVITSTHTGARLTLSIEHTGPLAWLVSSLLGRRTEEYATLEADGLVKAAGEA